MKKEIILVGIILLAVFAAGCSKDNNKLIGGGKDEHGCLIAAGYSWCEASQKCIRAWEENCSIEQKACTMEAKLCPDGSAVGRTGPNCEFAPCPESNQIVNETAECKCPEGYRKQGDVCKPECYYNTPRCMKPSLECEQ